jgi:hypothetical protein
MKIIGGNFGNSGSAYISRDKKLVISGSTTFAYIPECIKKINSRIEKERKFGFVGFILGSIILSIIFGIFLNILGVLIGIIIALIGSFYTNKNNIVDITFTDDNQVTLECTNRGVKSLYNLKNNKK